MAKKPASPYRFLNVEGLSQEMDLTVTAIRQLHEWGAPFIAKKSHPRLLIEWMARNPDKVLKLK